MRLAVPADMPALSALWAACFEDPQQVAETFFSRLWEEITVFTNDDVTAMATAMPVSWQGKKAAYLYAVATAPEMRGRGLCRRLLAEGEAFLREQGVSYALLAPASPSLFSFYGSLGYETVFYSDTRVYGAGTLPDPPVRPVPPEAYGALRARFGPEGVTYPLPLLSLQASAGPLLEISGLGCAAVEKTEEGFVARELLSPDPAAAAAALCAYLGVPSLKARIPGDEPFGMAKSLDESPLIRSYLGLAFE